MTHVLTVTPNSPTGAEHTITIEVHPSREAMLEYLDAQFPEDGWRTPNEAGTLPAGGFRNTGGYEHNHAPVDLGTIYLCEDWLDVNTIAHEATHAAMHVYACDVLGIYSRAMRHIGGFNEDIAYLVGDLVGDVMTELYDLGLYAEQETKVDPVP